MTMLRWFAFAMLLLLPPLTVSAQPIQLPQLGWSESEVRNFLKQCEASINETMNDSSLFATHDTLVKQLIASKISLLGQAGSLSVRFDTEKKAVLIVWTSDGEVEKTSVDSMIAAVNPVFGKPDVMDSSSTYLHVNWNRPNPPMGGLVWRNRRVSMAFQKMAFRALQWEASPE